MSRERQSWIEAAKVLGHDATAKVACPQCGEGDLDVQDVIISNTLERHLFCPKCGAKNSILMRI